MKTEDSLILRRANAEDAAFAFRVLEETMREYAIATWGTWWEQDSRRETNEQVSAGKTEIIEHNVTGVGIRLVRRTDTHIQLEQLYIAKAFQRRGLGTELLKRLMTEARESNPPIRLRVLSVNPARIWYERMGFLAIETTPERIFMEWRP